MNNHKDKPIEGEIVTPAQLDRILGRTQEPDVPQLDAILERFDQLLGRSLKVLDLDTEEGWLGEFWGGLDYRIAKKTERGQAMFDLIGTFMSNLEQFEKAEQKIRGLNRERYERYLDRIRAARTALEEQQKLEAVAANARLQLQIADAKARETIAVHEANIRKAGLEGRPSLPPPPSPKPEDPRAKNKARLQQELERLAKEEKAALDKIAAGKPQSEWTEDMKDEIKRTINMYYHAKEKVREELRKYL